MRREQESLKEFLIGGIALMEALFLLSVTTHCLLGLHGMLFDLDLQPVLKLIFTWLLVIVSIFTILYGWWLIRTIAKQLTL